MANPKESNYRSQTTEITVPPVQSEAGRERSPSTRIILPLEEIHRKDVYIGIRRTREIAVEMARSMGLDSGSSLELRATLVRNGRRFYTPGSGNYPECRVRYSLFSSGDRLYASPEPPSEKDPQTVGQLVAIKLNLPITQQEQEALIIDIEATSNKSFDPAEIPTKGEKKKGVSDTEWLRRLADEDEKSRESKKTKPNPKRTGTIFDTDY